MNAVDALRRCYEEPGRLVCRPVSWRGSECAVVCEEVRNRKGFTLLPVLGRSVSPAITPAIFEEWEVLTYDEFYSGT
jgi:hypothetical protein